jgi:hypothetical protein
MLENGQQRKIDQAKNGEFETWKRKDYDGRNSTVAPVRFVNGNNDGIAWTAVSIRSSLGITSHLGRFRSIPERRYALSRLPSTTSWPEAEV